MKNKKITSIPFHSCSIFFHVSWWIHCQRGRKIGKNVVIELFGVLGRFMKIGDHCEFEHLNCILLVLLPFLNLNCNSWRLTMIEGQIEQLFFHMDLKWDFWHFSGNWSFIAFFCLISLVVTFLKPTWSLHSFLLFLDQVVPLR